MLPYPCEHDISQSASSQSHAPAILTPARPFQDHAGPSRSRPGPALIPVLVVVLLLVAVSGVSVGPFGVGLLVLSYFAVMRILRSF